MKTTRKTTTRTAKTTARPFGISWLVISVLAIAILTTVGYLHHRHTQQTVPVTTTQITPIKPTFDFYHLLPKVEVPVSESAPTATRPIPTPSRNVPTNKPKAATKPTHYMLQVGSFKQRHDADALMAKLSLQGFEVTVKHFTTQSHQNWYRVWIGPYVSISQAKQVQTQLRQQRIDSLLHKVG